MNIYTFKDKSGNTVAPLTPEAAVFDENGVRLKDKLKSIDFNKITEALDEAILNIKNEELIIISNISELKVTPEMLSTSTKLYIESSGGGTITNLADDEDLTTKDLGEGRSVIKLADKSYNPEAFSGKGRKYLRKNITVETSKNILTLDMINEPNTIYIIQYDYDLNGAEITIPEGCTLLFDGGSFNNGKLIGNNTIIISEKYYIFRNVELSDKGTFNNLFFPEWFGAIGNGINDDYIALKKCITYASYFKIKVELNSYSSYFINSKDSNDIHLFNIKYIYLEGNNSIIKLGEIGDYESIFNIRGEYAKLYNFTITLSENNIREEHGTELGEGKRRTEFIIGGEVEDEDKRIVADIENIIINNAIGVWQFDFIRAKDSRIANCIINYTKQDISYDRTSIYLWGENINCYNNILNGTNSALTGIEFHGYGINVIGNKIINYTNPVFITNDLNSLKSEEECDLVLRNNYIKCRKGIMFWLSLKNMIDNIKIENNTIYVIENFPVIDFYDTINGGVKNISIKNNYLEQLYSSDTQYCILFKANKIDEGNKPVISEFMVENNTIKTKGYGCFGCILNASLKSLITIQTIKVSNNNIYLNRSSFKFLLDLNNETDVFSNIIVERNYIFNNSDRITTITNPNNIKITYIDNFTENTIKANEEPEIVTFIGYVNTKYNSLSPKAKIFGYDNSLLIKKDGSFSEKPLASSGIPRGFSYFCIDKLTTEGLADGIMIYHKGSDVWVDALGRTIQ